MNIARFLNRTAKRAALVILAAAVLGCGAGLRADEAKPVAMPLRFDHYYPLDEVYRSVKALGQAYPKMVTVEEVGKSDEGRAVMAVTITNPATGKAADKPAVYVDGNTHGNEIQGTEICLYLMQYLLENYGKNPEVTALLDRICFYVVPVVNVDGRYHFFADPNTSSSNRSLRIPVDDDRDGLVDEDFPDDLDGDGNICLMRKRDPFGIYKTDPNDPRLMVRVKPGEKGEWTILGEEGIDNDGDGLLNEDSEGYVDPNRNWGFDWQPSYVQQGSGSFPFSGVGLKALSGWIYSKPNICMGWSFHNYGGMFLRGPSSKSLGEYPPQDIAVYDFIGKQAEKIIPGYKYLVSWKDLYPTYGDSVEWMTQTLGVYAYCAEVYQAQAEQFREPDKKIEASAPGDTEGMRSMLDGPIGELERLMFNDNLAQGELYKPWKPFKHPTYGDIEIGGWVKFSERLPAPFMIEDMVHRNAMNVLFSAKHVPEVSLDVIEVKDLGNGLYRVRTRLSNPRVMPTMSGLAEKHNLFPKDMLRMSGRNAKVVAGGILLDPYMNQVAYKQYRPDIQFTIVPGFGKVEHQFIVSGSGDIVIGYESRHGGKKEKTVTLK